MATWEHEPDTHMAYLKLSNGNIFRTVDADLVMTAFDITEDGELVGIEFISEDIPRVMGKIRDSTPGGYGR